jgi:hypothetical protein
MLILPIIFYQILPAAITPRNRRPAPTWDKKFQPPFPHRLRAVNMRIRPFIA